MPGVPSRDTRRHERQQVKDIILERGNRMGLTSLDIVRIYRLYPIQDIQASLKEHGYLMKLSVIADMLQVVFLELELEEDKAYKELLDSAVNCFLPARCPVSM